jgi:predicted transcriptional regulator YheO
MRGRPKGSIDKKKRKSRQLKISVQRVKAIYEVEQQVLLTARYFDTSKQTIYNYLKQNDNTI